MLEFSDGEKHFCSGVMVEAFADSETREYQWILEDGKIENVKVYYNKEFLPAGSFRDGIREQGGVVCSTKMEYNSRLTHLLKVHRRNVHFNPYLEALVRSVNFTPFTSVNDFVCTYILEEQQVDISAMRENLANYKEAEREAVEMEKKSPSWKNSTMFTVIANPCPGRFSFRSILSSGSTRNKALLSLKA